jgi:hypothetical protein
MFNDLFSKTWSRQYLEQQECDVKRKYIESNEKTFCFVFDMKTGFANQTQNGISSSSNYSSLQFSRSFNAREGLIAQWQGAVKMDTCYLPAILTRDNIDKPFGNKNHEIESFYHWFQNNEGHFKGIINTYFSEGVSFFVNSEGEVKTYSNGMFGDDDIISVLTQIKNDTTGKARLEVVDNEKRNMSVYPYYEKWFEKGSYFMIVDSQADDGVNFDSAPGSSFMGDITQWELVQKVVAYSTTNITKEMLYKLYVIPQKNEGKSDDLVYYYINSCTKYYDPKGSLVYCQLEFASINDSLATTGQIVKGTIMNGAPGEGVAIPKLIYDNTGKAIDFEVDENYIGDQGVRTLQVECLGPAGKSGVAAYGRPIEKLGVVNKIYPPRRLLLSDLKYPVMDNMTTNSNPETVFTSGVYKPEIQSYYQDWKQEMSSPFTDSIKKIYDGYLAGIANANQIDATNDGKDLRRADWLIGESAPANDMAFTTSASKWFAALNKAGDNYIGSKTINLNNIGSKRYHDYLNFACMIMEQYPTIPIDSMQSYAWTLAQIPLIGGFLNTITLGIPIGWRAADYFPSDSQWRGIPLLVSKSLFNWYTKAFWNASGDDANTSRLPLDMFKSGVDDEVGGIVNSSAMTTAICGNLTDKITMATFNLDDGTRSTQDEVYSTIYAFQTITNDSGVLIKPLITEASFAESGDMEAITDTVGVGKYIIDAVETIGMEKMPVRLTTFSEDPDKVSDPFAAVNWQTTLQSKAMLTGNIRDVATVFKTSYFEDAKINSNVNFPFPNNNGNSAGKREDTFEDINTPELETSNVDFPDFHLWGDYTIGFGWSGSMPTTNNPHTTSTSTVSSLQYQSHPQSYYQNTNTKDEVIHDFKADGFVDIQQVAFAYKAITFAEAYFQWEVNDSGERTLGELSAGKSQDYSAPTAFLKPNLNLSTPNASGDKVNLPYVSISIQDLIEANNGLNIVDAVETYEDGSEKYVAQASIFFDKDNLTITCSSTTKSSAYVRYTNDISGKKTSVGNYVMYAPSQWKYSFGLGIKYPSGTKYRVSTSRANLNTGPIKIVGRKLDPDGFKINKKKD